MLVTFPRAVTMQGNGVLKAVRISQEESPLGEERRRVLPGQEAPAHRAPQGKHSLLWLLLGKQRLSVPPLLDLVSALSLCCVFPRLQQRAG